MRCIIIIAFSSSDLILFWSVRGWVYRIFESKWFLTSGAPMRYKANTFRNRPPQYNSRAVVVVFERFDKIVAEVERSMLLTCESQSLVADSRIQRRISRALRHANNPTASFSQISIRIFGDEH